MKYCLIATLAAALGLPAAASANCKLDIDTRDRALVIDEIGRARDMRHDGDEEGCEEQISDVLRAVNGSLGHTKPNPAGAPN
jgi:hypothetical protein